MWIEAERAAQARQADPTEYDLPSASQAISGGGWLSVCMSALYPVRRAGQAPGDDGLGRRRGDCIAGRNERISNRSIRIEGSRGT